MKRFLALLLVLTLFLMPASLTAYADFDYDAISSTDILKNGSRGSDVKKLQKALISLGYLKKGSADGVYGSKTEKAVKNFQKKNGFAGVVGYAGNATKFTQAAIYGTTAIPASSNRSISNTVSGEYGIRNTKLRYSTTLDGSFTFVNQETRHVKAICIYYWLADSKNHLVTMDGYEYWMSWYYNLDVAYNGTFDCSISLDATSKELGSAHTLRFIVGEIAYSDDSVYITFNAGKPPYNNANYILGSW